MKKTVILVFLLAVLLGLVLSAGVLAAEEPAITQIAANTYGSDGEITYASIRGTDRYDTAIRISQASFARALPVGSGVVVAPGESFQEALCGGPLAAAYGGPVLLSSDTLLYSSVAAELQRLGPDYVFCIGMTASLADQVRAALPAATVTPINGLLNNVYDMSRKVANELAERVQALGGDMSDAVGIVTRGDVFPDAIGVSPLACYKKWPIVLTSGPTGTIDWRAAAALDEIGITKALKVGTYATLPDGVAGLANLSGLDRYHTNCNVAAWARSNAGLSFSHLGLATGDKFPDALAVGPYLALDRGILFLCPLLGPVPACVEAEINTNAGAVSHISFIAMLEPVIEQVKWLTGIGSSILDLQAAINACPPGGTVTIPAGTYVLDPCVRLKSGVTLQGAGVDKTILAMPGQSVLTDILYAKRVSNAGIRDLTLTSPGVSAKVQAIHLSESTSVVVERVKVTNCDYALKVGSGCSDVTVRDFTARACGQVYVVGVDKGLFENLDLEMVTETYALTPRHALYVCADSHQLRFNDVRARGGDGYTVQLWTDYTDSAHHSDDIEFNGLDVAGHGMVIGGNFSHVTLNDLVVSTVPTRTCVVLGSAADVTIDGFRGMGGYAFLTNFSGQIPSNVTVRNGVYSGSPLIDPYANIRGLTVENVVSGGG